MRDATDLDDAIRAANPLTGQRPDAEIDAALARLLRTMPVSADEPRTPSWTPATARLALALGVLVIALVVAFAATNLLPPSGTPGGVSEAWAARVLARTYAALAGSGDGILHIDETVTVTATGPHSRRLSYQTESWQQQTSPYDYWSKGSDGSYWTIVNRQLEHYEAPYNTLYETPQLSPLEVSQDRWLDNPAWQVEARLLGHASTSASYADLIARLFKTQGATVDPDASVNGQAAISITSVATSGATQKLYVRPVTYEPVEEVISGRDGSEKSTIITKFSAYQTLPAGSVSPPNLQQLHPNARVTTGAD
jgi:hypothetical protein